MPARKNGRPIIQPDRPLVNADWTKQTKDIMSPDLTLVPGSTVYNPKKAARVAANKNKTPKPTPKYTLATKKSSN